MFLPNELKVAVAEHDHCRHECDVVPVRAYLVDAIHQIEEAPGRSLRSWRDRELVFLSADPSSHDPCILMAGNPLVDQSLGTLQARGDLSTVLFDSPDNVKNVWIVPNWGGCKIAT